MCNNISMERIAIFGGTFNPVHVEHIKIVESAINELNLDGIFVMPTFLSPHKTLIPAKETERLNMLKLAFSGISKVEVCDYEIKKGGVSFTYQTAEEFRNLYPDAQIFWIVGGDMLVDFKTWRYPERILSAVDLAVFNREDIQVDYEKESEYFVKRFGKNFVKLKYNGKTCCSTKIRVYSAFNLSLDGLAPKVVGDYIKENGLYKGDKYTEYILKNLPEKRIRHTANVVLSALSKAKELGLPQEKVMIAATLHDMAKYKNASDYPNFSLPQGVPKPVEHAFLGAYLAKTELGITDEEILDAIRFHTSGKANMTKLAKLIFTADMVEEDRDYQGVNELREYFKGDLDECFRKCLEEEIIHLVNKKQYIYAETLSAYDYYVKDKKN